MTFHRYPVPALIWTSLVISLLAADTKRLESCYTQPIMKHSLIVNLHLDSYAVAILSSRCTNYYFIFIDYHLCSLNLVDLSSCESNIATLERLLISVGIVNDCRPYNPSKVRYAQYQQTNCPLKILRKPLATQTALTRRKSTTCRDSVKPDISWLFQAEEQADRLFSVITAKLWKV